MRIWRSCVGAEESGSVLYLEGSTDLVILRAFARALGHPAQECLERPFVHYVLNQPQKARDHFYGLREAKADLAGFAICDRLDLSLPADPNLEQRMWQRREIENYLCSRDVLKRGGEAMVHHQVQAVGLRLSALLLRGDLFEVAFEELLEGGRLGLGVGDERALVHLDLDGARPLLGCGTGLEGLGLDRVALFPEPDPVLGLPLIGAAFSEGGHAKLRSFANECGNAVANNRLGTFSGGASWLLNV